MEPLSIFDFDLSTSIARWRVVDDVVMGGVSNGTFQLSKEGHGVFSGRVSLDNNGGFSSVRYPCRDLKLDGHAKVVIRLKGDGKSYQFRVKHSRRSYYSYIATFDTSGDWQDVEISLADMYPAFRGRTLSQPNFDHQEIEEIAFLIGNKRNESFELLIDKIELR